jgi:hypothetical protein
MAYSQQQQQYPQQPYPQQSPEYREQQQQRQQQQQFALQMSENKQTFEETFKIARPKWNDLWAGILVRHTFCCTHTYTCLAWLRQYWAIALEFWQPDIVTA